MIQDLNPNSATDITAFLVHDIDIGLKPIAMLILPLALANGILMDCEFGFSHIY